MILRCNVKQCGYHKNGRCNKLVLEIQENGTCGWLYQGNQVREGFDQQ